MDFLDKSRTLLLASALVFSVAAKAEEPIQVSDLMLDYDLMVGKEVSLHGFYLQMGDMAFLYEEPGSMTFVSVDSSLADRETRKYVLKNCSSGCEISLTGIVQQSEYGQKGIILKKVIE